MKSIFLLNVLMVEKYLIIPLEDENKKLESLFAFKEMPSSVNAELAFSSEIKSLLVNNIQLSDIQWLEILFGIYFENC